MMLHRYIEGILQENVITMEAEISSNQEKQKELSQQLNRSERVISTHEKKLVDIRKHYESMSEVREFFLVICEMLEEKNPEIKQAVESLQDLEKEYGNKFKDLKRRWMRDNGHLEGALSGPAAYEIFENFKLDKSKQNLNNFLVSLVQQAKEIFADVSEEYLSISEILKKIVEYSKLYDFMIDCLEPR